MRILIVDDDIVSLNKLNQILSSYGECETVGSGILALSFFSLALKENRPYGLVSLDIELPDISGNELLIRFREMEAEHTDINSGQGTFIIMVTSRFDHETVLTSVRQKCNGYVTKPFQRESLARVLLPLGLSCVESSGEEGIAPLPFLADRTRQILAKGTTMQEGEFTLLLRHLLDEPGEGVERVLIEYVQGAQIGDQLLGPIVNIMGIRPRDSFLPVLQDLVQHASNFNVRKQAIAAITQRNDEPAYNILTTLHKTITNSFLQKIVHSGLETIRQTHPYLGLIPQFLEGGQDMKAFQSVRKILKRILQPQDLKSFLPFLQREDPLVRLGTLELLCDKGGQAEEESITAFVRRELSRTLPGAAENEDYLYQILFYAEKYLLQDPARIVGLFDDLQQLFHRSTDTRTREILLNLLLQCPGKDFTREALELYRQREELRPMLLQSLAMSEAGAEFLFSEIEAGHPLQSKILPALLQNPNTAGYFLRNAPRMDRQTRLNLLQNIPVSHYDLFRDLVVDQLGSEDEEIVLAAMEKIRDHLDFSAESVLMEPSFLQNRLQKTPHSLPVLAGLFPIQILQDSLQQTSPIDCPIITLQTSLEALHRIMEYKPVLRLSPAGHTGLQNHILQWLQIHSSGDRSGLLRGLHKLYCYDMETLDIFQDALAFYLEKGGRDLTLDENQEVKRCRDQFGSLYTEIKRTQIGCRELKTWLEIPTVDFDVLETTILSYPIAFSLLRQEVIRKVFEALHSPFSPIPDGWSRICKRFPMWKLLVQTKTKTQRSFCIHFRSREVFALLRDQLRQYFPEWTVREKGRPEPHDFLIADCESFLSLEEGDRSIARKKIILLDKPTEFGSVKSYKPITMPAPLNLSRVLQSILQEFLA